MEADDIVIEPPRGWQGFGVRELWTARELLGFLMWREMRVRYAHATLGVAWTVLQPLATMAVFTVVFSHLGGVATNGVPYPLFALVGLVTWTFVSSAISAAAESLIGNPTLVTKVYFPRLVIPLAPVGSGFVDLAIAAVLLLVGLLYYGIVPSLARIWLLVPATAILLCATAGLGVLLAAVNLRFRDARYTIPFGLQLWFFASPIAWPMTSIPPQWRALFVLNPLAGVIEAYRAALLPSAPLELAHLAIAALVSLGILLSGISWFRLTERVFADLA